MKEIDINNLDLESQAVRINTASSNKKEHSAPIYMTSSFMFDSANEAEETFADKISGNIYTRFSNPNHDEFVAKMCAMEFADDGMAMASGMAAVFATFGALLKSGDHIVSSRSVFGSTHQLLTNILPKWGISSTYLDMNKTEVWQSEIKTNTKLIYVETPSNPSLDLIDLEWLGSFSKKNNLILVVDNCFCTPYIQQPMKYGADLVIHSATKYIDGQGRAIGGIVLGNNDLIKEIRFFARHTGPALSPFNSWIFSKSLETLAIRMDRHCQSALEIAQTLENHSALNFVKYPFLESHPDFKIAKKQMKLGGGILTFEIKGGIEAAKNFIDNLKMFSITANLGDTRTIVTHPATTTHSKLSIEDRQRVGISDGLIRISVGLESVKDILDDILQALQK